MLVVDEAYVEFSSVPSLLRHLDTYPHLVILRTLSKAHGLAGARCGSLLANPEIVGLLRRRPDLLAINTHCQETVIQ